MSTFIYQEPNVLALGIELYKEWGKNKNGNVVSILSNAMFVLRQLGPTGLDLWIDCNDKEREFIRTVLGEELNSASEQTEMNSTWSLIEHLMRELRYAKYYAKTQKEDTKKTTA